MKLSPTIMGIEEEKCFPAAGSLAWPVRVQGRKSGLARTSGFTLIEMMVTVAVAAILAAVALPYLNDFIGRSRARGVASELEAALQYARVEAMVRSTYVEVCAASRPITDPRSAECARGAGAGDAWRNGWLVRVARAIPNALGGDPDPSPDGSDVLRTSKALAPDIRISHSGDFPGSVIFWRSGTTGLLQYKFAAGALVIGRTRRSTIVPEACLLVDHLSGRIRRGVPTGTGCA